MSGFLMSGLPWYNISIWKCLWLCSKSVISSAGSIIVLINSTTIDISSSSVSPFLGEMAFFTKRVITFNHNHKKALAQQMHFVASQLIEFFQTLDGQPLKILNSCHWFKWLIISFVVFQSSHNLFMIVFFVLSGYIFMVE